MNKTLRVRFPSKVEHGFTLLELLVVIGILAVILAFLLPVLSGVRKASKKLVCVSNLRQIGIATFIYATDHGGAIPAYRSWEPAIVFTNGYPVQADDERPFILSVVTDKRILYCPLSDLNASKASAGSGGWDVSSPDADSWVGYSLIGWWINIAPEARYRENFTLLPFDPVSNRPTKFPISGRPDRIAIALDAQHSYNGSASFTFPGSGSPWTDGPLGIHFYPHRRNNGAWDGNTTVFFDGHVEYKRREDLVDGSGLPMGYQLNIYEGRNHAYTVYYW